MRLNGLFHLRSTQCLVMVLIVLLSAVSVSAATANVTAAASHGLILSALGNACGVGENEYGELGDGTNNVDRTTPVPVATLVGALNQVSTGYYHSVGLKADGTVWTWGYNGYGELGSGNTTNRPTPFSVAGLTNVVSVAAGNYHTLAVKSDGTVWAWGNNGYGQLGDGTTTGRPTPVQVIQLSNVIAVAAGQDYFSLALKSDGTVWAWGYNGYGQLGDGTTTNRTSPVQVASLSGVSQIAAGRDHSMARKSDGTVWAWGYGGYGQLGNGSTASQSSITRAGSLASAISIAAGDYHSLAVQSDGSVWAWGYNGDGELGDGTTTGENAPLQIGANVTGFSGFSAVAAGGRFSLALQANGATWAWGYNTDGQLGDGDTTQTFKPGLQNTCPSPLPPNDGLGASAFTSRLSGSVANKFTLFAKSDGTVWGSGDNTYGQLGDGTQINRASPVQSVNITGATGVSAGQYHSLAVTSDGSIWSWGYNNYGELGNGSSSNHSVPAAISGFTGAVAVAAGSYHSLALRSDGTVWGFGYNGYGQLGDGTTTNRILPVQIPGLTGVTAIAAGGNGSPGFSLALKSDGTVWAWGYNGYGALGDGTTTNRSSPVQVAGLTNVIAIAAGGYHSLALRSDGTVWAWGYDGYGDLGDGGSASEYNIVRVSGLTNVIAISAGNYHSIAVTSDGSVWTWGYNGDGELGDASTSSSSVPVKVIGLTGALAVSAGMNDSIALTTTGSLSAWGKNDEGQFGISTPASSTVAITSATGVILVSHLTAGPPTGGVIVIRPFSPTGYYATGSVVCLIAEPANGYIFTGWSGAALNSAGCLSLTSDATVAANFAVWTPSTALSFVPVTPCRVADTRAAAGPLGAPSLVGGATRSFTVPGTCGIPAQAQAFSLNLTVVPHGTLGYVSLWPTGQSQPNASTLNSPDGRVKSNAAIIPAGSGGAVSVFATDNTDAILDINGYFVPAIDPSALAFYPLTPCRVADTRSAAGALGGPYLVGQNPRTFPVPSSPCNIPAGALAYSLNFTAIPHRPLNYLTVYPTGQSQPVVSTLNAPTAGVTANAAIVPAGTAGAIDLFVTDDSDMIIDVNGYFAAGGSGGYALYNLAPCRIEDSRNPPGTQPFAGTLVVTATGVPCGVPPAARALVSNATVVPSGQLGYLTLWPDGGSQPVVSTLNSLDGSITSNMALVPTTDGFIDGYAAGPGPTYLILDISGFFAPAQ